MSSSGDIDGAYVAVRTCADNPINQTILSTFMKKKKIKFDVAKNGEEAVAKWQTGGFHLILVSTSCTPLVLRSRLLTLFPDGHPDACHGRYRGY